MQHQHEVATLVKQLNLLPHPEGGFYAETYRCSSGTGLHDAYRAHSTAIYFLLTAGNFSAFHRIKSDEVWHHYLGDPVHIHVIDKSGDYTKLILGKNFIEGELPQHVVHAGDWFASESIGSVGYSLVGCTVAPGFDFADFELADRQELMKQYSAYAAAIERLSR